MKISVSWLKQYLDIKLSAEEMAHRLTMAGLEVEKIVSMDGDTVMELEITPNRPDCLNMRGIARETAAMTGKTCQWPLRKKQNYPSKKCDIQTIDKSGCPLYVGIFIKDVVVTQSPAWLQQRLCALGIRGINNAVDITNYCLMDRGQPLHAFDYDKLKGGKIVVRRASAGEKIVTLDGIERSLDASILVIADAERPVAIAGIMGGKDTEVTLSTKNILLESAYFDPILIRRAARKLGISTEASYRFERGIDIAQVEEAAHDAVQLIRAHAQGTVAACTVAAFVRRRRAAGITIKNAQIAESLGKKLSLAEGAAILKRLGFTVGMKKDSLRVLPPSWRKDVRQPVDLVEEIARVIGYDRLPAVSPMIKINNILPARERGLKNALRQIFTAQGFSEAITYSMTNQVELTRSLHQTPQGIKIQNPLTHDQEQMRPSMLPGLLRAALLNANRGQRNLKLFEIGKIYADGREQEALALLMTGTHSRDWRRGRPLEVDYYDLKGGVEQALRHLGLGEIRTAAAAESYLEHGHQARVIVQGSVLGVMGRMDAKVLANWDIKINQVFFAQMDMDVLYALRCRARRFEAVSEFPSITRDISLAVKDSVMAQDVLDRLTTAAAGQKNEWIVSVRFVEKYEGENIPEGFKAMMFSVNYASSEKTLRDDEVNAAHEKIVCDVLQACGAVRR